MKIIKRVKLARIPYGELEVGNRYQVSPNLPYTQKGSASDTRIDSDLVITPESYLSDPESVTWDIVGIDGKRAREDIEYILVYWGDLFAEGNYETIYE